MSGARDLGEKGDVFKYGRPNKIVNDYSTDATLRSIEDSLKRLGTDHVEIAWVHDVAQDFYGDEWLGVFESARKGAFKALDRLRDEGVIKAWGLGVNRVEPIELLLALEGPRPDGFLLAGRYTLLDHDRALQRVMPMVAEHGLGIVVGGPYSSGALVGGPNFEYAPAPRRQSSAKVARIKAIADRHGVSMKARGPAVRARESGGRGRDPRREPPEPHRRGPRRPGRSRTRRFLARAARRRPRQSRRAASHGRLDGPVDPELERQDDSTKPPGGSRGDENDDDSHASEIGAPRSCFKPPASP